MPLYVLNRDFVLATTAGHRIRFAKGEPVNVPPRVVPDAVAIGATPADGSEPDIAPKAPASEPVDSQDPEKREKMLLDAMRLLADRNDKDDFGGDNSPKIDAIRALVGFKIDRNERDQLWQKYNELVAAGH